MLTPGVPKKDKEFNEYIRATTKYLSSPNPAPPPRTHYGRLGVSGADMGTWVSFHDLWCGPSEKAGVWGLATNPFTKTATVKFQKDNMKKRFAQFAERVIQAMAANPNFNEADHKLFNVEKNEQVFRAQPRLLVPSSS